MAEWSQRFQWSARDNKTGIFITYLFGVETRYDAVTGEQSIVPSERGFVRFIGGGRGPIFDLTREEWNELVEVVEEAFDANEGEE